MSLYQHHMFQTSREDAQALSFGYPALLSGSIRLGVALLWMLLMASMAPSLLAQTTVPYNTPGTHTFTVPAGVNQITIQAWGAGGGGGRSGDAGGGGGGGAFTTRTISVTSGQTYTIIVGAGGAGATAANGTAGGHSIISLSATTILQANGGAGASGRAGGAGGSASTEPSGVISFAGGSGGSGSTAGGNNQRVGGGGGGSATSAANGGNGQDGGNQTGGAGGIGEGDGGSGSQGNNTAGNVGNAPGGGGGGGGRNGNGGAGAGGRVIISYEEVTGPTDMIITTQPGQSVAGQNIAGPPTVRVLDIFEDPVSGVDVTVSLNKGSFAAGTITRSTNSEGYAIFDNLVINAADSDYQLTFNADATGVDNAISNLFNVVAAAASNLSITVQPGESVGGGIIPGPPTVQVTDAFGNAVSGLNVTVSLVGGTFAGGTFTKATNASGIAVFDDLVIDEDGENYRLRFSALGVDDVDSNTFNVLSSESTLTLLTSPGTTTAGIILSPNPSVELKNFEGTPIQGVNITVSLNKGIFASGTLTVMTDANGVAVFDDLVIETADTDYRIIFDADESGVANVNSAFFDVTPAAPSQMTMSTQPGTTVAGQSIAGPPAIVLTDAFGNPVGGVNVSVSLNKNSFSSGTFTVATNSEGIATFGDLQITVAATTYQLTFNANATGVADIDSDSFNVVAAAASSMSITVQPETSVAGDFILGPPTVLVTDIYANPTSGVQVNVTLNQNTFASGTTSLSTNTSGLAVFGNLVINTLATGYQLTFNADATGVADVGSNLFDVIEDRTISGTILDGEGNPVAGVSVAATGDLVQTVSTNSVGFYQFTGVQSGNRTIDITPSLAGYTFDPVSITLNNNFSGTPNVGGQDFTAIAITGTYYSRQTGNWNDPASWSESSHTGGVAGRAPVAGDEVIVGNGHTITLTESVSNNESITINSTGILRLETNLISGSGGFTLASGATLQIGSADGISSSGASGNIQVSGIRSFSTGANYAYNGGSAQQTGTGLPTEVNNLTINNSSGVTAASSLTVNGTLTLTSGTFIMPAGASLVTNSVSGSGQVRMQLLINGGKGWYMASSPVGTTYGDLFNGFVTQGYTGSSFPDLQPNILWFDETEIGTTNMAWRTPSNSTNSVVGGRGHFQYVFNGAERPDEAVNYPDQLPITMTANGQEFMTGSSFNFNVSHTSRSAGSITDTDIVEMNTGWNLLGNPTTASLDWEASGWTRTNVDDTYYIWVPGANGGNGDYFVWNQLISDTENPDYIPNELSNGVIAPFQAFWVRANAASPALGMTHAVKTTGGEYVQNGLKSAVAKSYPNPIVLPMKMSAGGMQSRAYITFSETGRMGEDPHDGYRLEPMSDSFIKLYTTTSQHNEPLVINNLPIELDKQVRIPLYTGGQKAFNPVNGTYTLDWSVPSVWPANWGVVLMDHTKQEAINMRHTNSIQFERFETRSNLAAIQQQNQLSLPERIVAHLENPVAKSSLDPNRFTIVITPGDTQEQPKYSPDTPALLMPYPNPVRTDVNIGFTLPEDQRVRVEILDLHGRRVAVLADQVFQAGHNALQTWNVSALRSGIYIVSLQAETHRDTQKITVIR